ncbi:MAG: DUF3267 domain-containing protein [Bacillota bacterium]|nr:DUF3267 domain-containing protein [Bacillota bacterium]
MKIKWKGKLTDANQLSTVELPKNAVEFCELKSIFEYCILGIPIVVLVIFCLYIKAHFVAIVRMNLTGKIIGVLLAFLFVGVHELIHAICFPPKAIVEIYFNKYGLCTTSSSPSSKKRSVIIAILPSLVLGIIPLILWTFIPIQNIMISTIWYFFAIGSFGAGIADIYTMINIITKMPKGSMMQISGYKFYYFNP